MVTGAKDYAHLAFQVAGAGDTDGDGYADLLVGAPFYDSNIGGGGRVFLYRGSASGPSSTPSWSYTGDISNGELGFAVAAAGDLNGDGYGDVAVGAPQYGGAHNVGRVLVFFGSSAGLPAVPSAVIDGDQGGAGFGAALAGAGDVNGDGYDDLLVGQPYYQKTAINGIRYASGRAFLYLGGPAGLSATPAAILEPETFGGNFGFSVAGTGDLDGDGLADIIVGNPMFDIVAPGSDNQGRVYVYRGSSNGVDTTPVWTATGPQIHSLFGVSVAGAGDVNGDGYRDVVVGARTWSSVINTSSDYESDEGLVEVFLGSGSGLGTSPGWTAQGPAAGSNFGISVSGGADVNGDGFSDILVGASSVSHGEYNEGQVVVFYGSAAGPAASPGWAAESNQGAANFGLTVAFAGDVNGDTLDDILIGTQDYHDGFMQDGGAFLYEGSPTGNLPPHAHAGQYAVRECGGPSGAMVTLDGGSSSDLNSTPGTNNDIVAFRWYEGYGTPAQSLLGVGATLDVALALGTHAVTLEVVDTAGASSTDTAQVKVVDTVPPVLSASVSPAVLWPPNHRQVAVRATVTAVDACGGATVALVSVTSSEPDDAPGLADGVTTGDITGADGTSGLSFKLRAERAQDGAGRVYTAVYAAMDGSGNVATAAATVTVPLLRNGVDEPLMVGVAETPSGTVVSWPSVPDAANYDVIRGDLGSLRDAGTFVDLGTPACLAGQILETSTTGCADAANPPLGLGFYYLVQYRTDEPVSFGTVTVPKPSATLNGACL